MKPRALPISETVVSPNGIRFRSTAGSCVISEGGFSFGIAWSMPDSARPVVHRASVVSGSGLTDDFPRDRKPGVLPVEIESLAMAVRNYFRGEGGGELPADLCDLSGMTPFRRNVLKCLRRSVPAGCRITYRHLAECAGFPQACRAVGTAMRNNPFPLLFPCHRVVKTDGALGGYTPDIGLKKLLLEHERKCWRP